MKAGTAGKRIATVVAGLGLGLLLAALAALFFFARDYTLIAGQVYPRDVQTLDLRGANVRGTLGLLHLRAPESLDLRGAGLTTAQAEKLKTAFPACALRWDIPIGEGRYDSAAQTVAPGAFTADDVPAFALFDDLREVDAEGLDCYDALAALTAAYPELKTDWSIALGSRRFGHGTRILRLAAADADAGELRDRLRFFTGLTRADIAGLCLTNDEQRELMALYPDVSFRWEVETVCGLAFSSDAEELDLAGYGGFSLDALRALRPLFPKLKLIDLTGCGFRNEELLALRDDLTGVDVRWTFLLCGASVCTTATEIDLSNHPVEDVSLVEDALFYFPYLEKVVMCDCGVSDEEMDALDKRHEDIRFVWMIHFGDFFLRTDATTFIATTFPYGYTYLTNEQLEPLRYCTDLTALDLGHMYYSDVSFLRYLTKLQYLILSDTKISDISMLADMPDLYYLEIFLTNVSDVTPLLSCRNLRHLNIAFCPVKDYDTLAQMTWLERLWAPGIYLSWGQMQKLAAALPDTNVCYNCGSATGGTWRTDEAYFQMRDVFGVYYMPG